MPWQKNYDNVEVLERAMHAFWLRGYAATSINELVEAMGINRGSIYTAYANKHELFMQALRHYDKVYRKDHISNILELHPPKQAIIALFESAANKPANEQTPWGCLLVNSALELSPHDAEVRDFVEYSFRQVEEFFFTCLELSQQDEKTDTTDKSRLTAQALLSLFLGLRVLTRSQARQSAIDAIISQARMML